MTKGYNVKVDYESYGGLHKLYQGAVTAHKTSVKDGKELGGWRREVPLGIDLSKLNLVDQKAVKQLAKQMYAPRWVWSE